MDVLPVEVARRLALEGVPFHRLVKHPPRESEPVFYEALRARAPLYQERPIATALRLFTAGDDSLLVTYLANVAPLEVASAFLPALVRRTGPLVAAFRGSVLVRALAAIPFQRYLPLYRRLLPLGAAPSLATGLIKAGNFEGLRLLIVHGALVDPAAAARVLAEYASVAEVDYVHTLVPDLSVDSLLVTATRLKRFSLYIHVAPRRPDAAISAAINFPDQPTLIWALLWLPWTARSLERVPAWIGSAVLDLVMIKRKAPPAPINVHHHHIGALAKLVYWSTVEPARLTTAWLAKHGLSEEVIKEYLSLADMLLNTPLALEMTSWPARTRFLRAAVEATNYGLFLALLNHAPSDKQRLLDDSIYSYLVRRDLPALRHRYLEVVAGAKHHIANLTDLPAVQPASFSDLIQEGVAVSNLYEWAERQADLGAYQRLREAHPPPPSRTARTWPLAYGFEGYILENDPDLPWSYLDQLTELLVGKPGVAAQELRAMVERRRHGGVPAEWSASHDY